MLNKVKTTILFWVCLALMVGAITIATASPLPVKSQDSASFLSSNMVEVLVANDSSAERERAFTEALKLLLITKSKNPRVVNELAVKSALSKSGHYVKQFSYVDKILDHGKPALLLRVTFNSKATDKLLGHNQTKVEVLPSLSSKPLTIMWLVKDVEVARIVTEEGIDEGLVNTLRKKAEELGVPVILPTFDAQDASQVKVRDICKFNTNVVKLASRRYGTPVVVIGCIRKAILGSAWSSQWILLQGAKSHRFTFTGESVDSIIKKALPALSNNITNVITPVSGQDTKIMLRITNVDGLDQYNEITRYLHGFNTVITQVDLVNISANGIELALIVKGGEEALLDVLSNQGKLVPNPGEAELPPGIDLDYLWVVTNNEKPQTISSQPVS